MALWNLQVLLRHVCTNLMVWPVVNESNSLQYPGTHSLVCIILYTYSHPGYRSYYSDLLQAEQSGDRIPLEAEFCAPFLTAPGDHPRLLYSGCRFFLGGKAAGEWC